MDEPYVLPFEQVQRLKTGSQQWIEYRNVSEMMHIPIQESHKIPVSKKNAMLYGTDWRVWSDKPTPEQRRMVPWRSRWLVK